MLSVYFDAKFQRWCIDYGTRRRYFKSSSEAYKFAYGC